MDLDKKYIKYFPECEEVFIGDMDQYRKHFLPICSINLQAIYPEENQWLHFVSVNEIYDGCVGQETQDYHTDYCKEDMVGFNVIGDKYEFEADWKYFVIEHGPEEYQLANEEIVKLYRDKLSDFVSQEAAEEWVDSFGKRLSTVTADKLKAKYKLFATSEDKGFVNAMLDRFQKQAIQADSDSLAGAYRLNQATYDLAKNYYKKHNRIYPFTIGNYFDEVFTLEKLEENVKKDRHYVKYPEMYGILDDIQFHSKGCVSLMKEYTIPLEKMKSFENTNLTEVPRDQDGNIFEYVGTFTGYLFQCFGADHAYLFYNKELRKAVVCFEYT
ncbi:hypothetical protein LZQ00_12365 [Sphingobacterium sp. SRCM116780]|uniref:hypothetical protein n=1 Tax=Sphingobacterium sp. SRCM116780 TaxID=2907623 RepID=UPI001F39C769|nr:hypothetical protein [Sphingobacterium sp. SRCM116780]UIR55073.1 hypothetical protein LZQ00_12365 [Sphingobacterium sp. SRCM116780]